MLNISEERIVELLKQGDKDELIKECIELAIHIANKYRKKNNLQIMQYNYILAEAFYALVNIVNKLMPFIEEENIKYIGLIYITIDKAILQYILRDNVTGRRLQREYKIINIKNLNLRTYSDKLLEIEEIIKFCIKNEEEDKIVQLRIQGKNDKEISEIIGKTNVEIGKIRAKLKRRFDLIYHKE